MNSLGSFHRRWRLEVGLVLVPLVAIAALQYVWNARLAKVELIAHQSTLLEYLDEVAVDVRRTYEGVARETLAVPGEALAAKRFDVIARHFDEVDTSAARQLFAGSLEGCWCLTQYYNPETGHIGIGADPALEAVVARITMLLRWEWAQHLNRSEIYVDELDVGGLSLSLLNFAGSGLPVSASSRLFYATSATAPSGGASTSRAATR